ncbi:M14 family metallopeptidase [Porcipelethomonas sp.]|uniref:M14 family metallopeptidase n=1 Tax=Porcipelethomonas sp. TaxID=2981675 RepID=UPI003EF80311
MIETVTESMLAVNEKLKIQKSSISNGNSKKRICVVTGIHGDELEGQYLVYLLGKYLKENISLLDGTVDIYPALNPMGIDSITRGIPLFDIDMNRLFPGSKDGTMMETLCAGVIDDIMGADICIDVHSSNIFLKELPQIRISVPTAETLVPYAKMLNVDFIWVHESATVLESTLAHSLNSRGTKTLVVEMGVGMRITEEYCYQLFDGIINLMANLGMWKGEIPSVREPLISLNGAVGFVNSKAAGIFVPIAGFGDHVKKGEHIGDVLNPLTSEVEAEITAVCDGMIFTLREYPIVYGGSLLARILNDKPDDINMEGDDQQW